MPMNWIAATYTTSGSSTVATSLSWLALDEGRAVVLAQRLP